MKLMAWNFKHVKLILFYQKMNFIKISIKTYQELLYDRQVIYIYYLLQVILLKVEY